MHRHSLLRSCALAGLLCLAPATGWAQPVAAQQASPLDAQTIVASNRLDRAAVERLARDADVAGTDALVPFDTLANDPGLSADRRAMADLAAALILWRNGDLGKAAARARRSVDLSPSFDGYVLVAQLAALTADREAAIAAYGEARALARDASERASLARRIALLDPGTEGANIASLAQTGAADARPVAEALALTGHPAQSLAIGRQVPDSDTAWKLMLAQEALQAGDEAAAAEYGWDALRGSASETQKRYALSLLVEGASTPAARAGLAEKLAALPPSEAVTDARISLLMGAQDYEAALELLSGRTDKTSRDLRLELLRTIGDPARIEAEFQAALAKAGDDPAPYARLALLRLSEGDDRAAEAVFGRYFAADHTLDSQVDAAQLMLGMGLDEAALAQLERLAREAPTALGTNFALFDALLARGDDAAARAVLERLDAAISRSDPVRADLADAWDRLGDREAALKVLTGLSERGLLDYDRQVHIVQLLEQEGRDEAALAGWHKLWRETQLPARRSFLETRLVRAAQRLNRLDALAAEAESALATRASRSALELLVAIRMMQGERRKARDAVARFAGSAGMGEGDRLRQLVTIYARTQDYAALDDALAQLAKLEPAQADIYLRQRILAVLNQPGAFDSAEDQQAAIDALIGQLEAGTGNGSEAASRSAAIYELASLNDRAIAGYRRAVALASGYGEDLQQWVKLLGTQGREAEAIAVASYAFVNAPDPVSRARASDALMSVARASGGEDRLVAARIEGAQDTLRRAFLGDVLEEGASPDILARIADIAAAGGRIDDQIYATEMMLPGAADQRADILRRLVTMTSSREESANGPAFDGDAVRKAAYGKRLVALQVEYPPEVYADVGTTLLGQDDLAGAARAFALMDDLGGLVNVDAVRARAYQRAGLLDQALARYATALLHDRRDPELIVETSILREAFGQEPLAHRWYREGLQALIARQPAIASPEFLEGERGLDIRRYYPILLEGLVLTANEDGQSDASFQAFAAQMDAAITQTGDTIADYREQARARLAADVAFRLATTRADGEETAALRDTLSNRFGNERALDQELSYRRHLTGLPNAPDVPLEQALAVQARDSGNFFLATHLALDGDDRAWLDSLLAEALDHDARERALPVVEGPPRPPRGLLLGLTLDALAALPPAQFRDLIWDRIPAGSQREALAFDILRATPRRYDELQKALNARVIENASLMDRIVDGQVVALPLSAQSRAGSEGGVNGLASIIDRFSVAEKIALYERLVDKAAETGIGDALAVETLQQLLLGSLTDTQRSRLTDALGKQAVGGRGAEDSTAAWFVPNLLMFDVPPENQPVLFAGADALARRFPDGEALPKALRAWYAGDRDAALALFRKLYAETRAATRTSDYLARIEQRYFADQVNAEITDFLTADLGVEEAATFYRDVFAKALDRGLPADLVSRVYARLAAIDPGNDEYVAGYLLAARQADMSPDAVAVLRAYLEREPNDRAAGMALSLALLEQRKDTEAAEVARKAGIAFEDTGSWREALKWALSGPQTANDMRRLASLMFGDVAQARPGPPLSNAMAMAPEAREAMAGVPLARAVLEGRDNSLRDLRIAWRQSIGGGGEGGATPIPRDRLVYILAEQALAPGAPPLPLQASELIADLLRGVDDAERGHFIPLYRAAARGFAATGASAPQGGSLSHTMHLRAALWEAQGTSADVELVRNFLRAHPVLSASQRFFFAAVLGRAGDGETAARLVRDGVLQMRYGEDEPPVLVAPTRDVPSPEAFASALACWTDEAKAREAYRDVERILGPVVNRGATGAPAIPPFPECELAGTTD